MTALPGYLAGIWLAVQPSITFTNLVLTDSGDHIHFSLSETDIHRYWDPDVALAVQTAPDGSTWTTANPSTYTVQYVGGMITFASAVTGGTPSARVSGKYMALAFIGDAKTVDIKTQLDVMDSTVFTNPPVPWKTKVATLGDSDVSLGKWHVDTSYLGYLSQRLLLSLYNGRNAQQRYECFALMKDDSIKISEKDLTSEDLSFTSDGAIYFIAS
jgi:hypothetical protein